MLKKQWSQNPNKEHIVGPCTLCEKEIINTDSFVTLGDKTRACIKCYVYKRQMLPFKNK